MFKNVLHFLTDELKYHYLTFGIASPQLLDCSLFILNYARVDWKLKTSLIFNLRPLNQTIVPYKKSWFGKPIVIEQVRLGGYVATTIGF